MSAPAFSRRVAIILGVVAATSFLGGIVFGLLGEQVREEASHEVDSFSRSAIGHHALLSLLRALEVPVVVSRTHTGRKAGPDTALLLLEPAVEADDPTVQKLPEMIRETAAGVVIVALPKWRTDDFATHEGFVRSVTAHDGAAEDVLRALEIYARLRPARGGWVHTGPAEGDQVATPPDPDLPHRPRVIEGGALVPYLADAEGGVLIGEVETLGRTVVVVADPDLLNNAGLLRGRNAELVTGILAAAVGPRAVVLDETLHGFAAPPNVFGHLLRFPLGLATLQVVLVLVLVLWAGMRRFGAPIPYEGGHGHGRRVLVENTARVLWFGGHTADALTRYWLDTRRDVSQRLHAPPALGPAELHRWLDDLGANRGVRDTTTELEAEVATAGRQGARILAAARRIHAWRTAILQDGQAGSTWRNQTENST